MADPRLIIKHPSQDGEKLWHYDQTKKNSSAPPPPPPPPAKKTHKNRQTAQNAEKTQITHAKIRPIR